MQIGDLIFIGLSKYVCAVHRDTGKTVWMSHLRRGYVSLLLDGDRLMALINGYVYCLNPLTGETLWQNPLSGMGTGVGSIASCRGRSTDDVALQSAKVAEDSA